MARLRPVGGRLVAFLVTLLLLWPSWTASPAGASAPPDKPGDPSAQTEEVPDELIVGFKHGASQSARDAAVAAQGGQTTSANDRFDFRVVKIPPGQQKKEAINKYLNDPAVRYAEPNFVYHSSLEPNDPKYTDGTLWGLKNTGQTVGTQVGTADADIDAELAWATTTGSSNVVVGVVDTGITYTHPDLIDNVWSAPQTIGTCAAGTHGYRKTGVTTSCDPADDHYHGTHVAGTIGAKGNNGTGVVGVNWDVQIMGLKFLNAGGSGSTADAVAVLGYALQAREAGVNLRVLNNSWGGGGYSQALYDAIAALGNAGVLFVASAGNNTNNNDASPSYPASYNLPNIVAVAATDNRDQLASFSNYGATTVDLGAPGVNIYSTVPTSANASGYAYLSGTSMAAPHVTGVAALVLSAPGLGNLTYTQLKQRLVYCGDPIAALNGRTLSGRRLNAANALAGCPVPNFTVSIASARGGTAGVTPVAPTYDIETQITLTATADTGFAFTGWQINGTDRGSANPLTLSITSNLTVVPVFTRTTPFENFDTVTAPALPPGWTTSRTGATCGGGDSGPWRTVTDSWDTAPNAAFAGDPNCVSDNSLDSPAFVVPNDHTLLSFRQRYDLESTFDGGVLEIAIGAGSFADIVAAGGSFIAGGYSGTIDTHYSNPLAGRRAWSGASGGWVTTTVSLPPAAAGQTVKLRWRLGSDNAVAKTGWWVDTIVVDPVVPSALSVAAASGPYGGTATLSATLTSGGTGLGGKTIAFTVGGTPACGTGGTPACPATGGDGVATLPNASLAGQAVGAHPGAIGASFAGDAIYDPSSGSAALTVATAAQTITFGPLSDRFTSDPAFTVSATASSGLPVTFTAGPSAVCTASGTNGATISPVGAGTCTVTANQAGDANYLAAAAVAQQFALTANPYLLTVTIHGPGTVGPGSGNYPPGPIALTATPDDGAIFLGWTVDGTFTGWNPTLNMTLGGSRTVVATFATVPSFSDVATTDPAWTAITQLAARGVIKGYGDGRFGPDDPVLRAQVAALLVRAFGWDTTASGGPSSFSDLDGLDPELQRAVEILAARGIARGYPDGTFDPTGEVLRIQVISFITRSMVQAGYWQAVTQDDINVYPNVPLDSGHRLDLLTFVKYAGAIPGQPANQPWSGWNTSGPRAWTAQMLWQALDSYFSTNHVP